jgi:phosphoglycolate phosphatase
VSNLDYHLLVFDWDGTLMDSEARIVACLQSAIEVTGAEPRPSDRLSHVIGLGLGEAIRSLYPDQGPGFVDAFAGAYRERFLALDHSPSELFDGALETLELLRERGYRLAIATGKARRGLDRVLGKLALTAHFDATRCADETRSKPDPQMLHELMNELALPPERTLMIGDTEYDMQMAANAGVAALAVSYGVHPVDALLRIGARGHIDAISELPDWLSTPSASASLA